MISFFKLWCENIIIGILISIIIELICPERFLSYIKIIVGIFLLYLIIVPFTKNVLLNLFEKDIKDVFVSSDKVLEESKNNVGDIYKNNKKINDLNNIFIVGVESNIKEKLKQNGISKFEVKVNYDNNLESITYVEIIKISNINIEDDENIKNKITDIIIKEINIDKDLIIFKWGLYEKYF